MLRARDVSEWQSSATFRPEPSALDLWRVNLDLNFVGAHATLSTGELQRAERFHAPALSQRWISSRFALRSILSRYLHLEPDKISFSLNGCGKPSLALSSSQNELSSLEFNLSHSSNIGVIGISYGASVGVDCEKINPDVDIFDVGRVVFSSDELVLLGTCSCTEALYTFYELWTKKEAWLKMLGCGLVDDIAGLSVLKAAENFEDVHAVTISNLNIHDDYVAAYSVDRKLELVRMFDFAQNV